MAQTVSIKQSIGLNVKHIQWKNIQKNRLFVLESCHSETIFKQNLFTEGSERSWPRGLRLYM